MADKIPLPPNSVAYGVASGKLRRPAVARYDNKTRQRIGAKRDQYGNLQPTPVAHGGKLSAEHDRTPFENAFGRSAPVTASGGMPVAAATPPAPVAQPAPAAADPMMKVAMNTAGQPVSTPSNPIPVNTMGQPILPTQNAGQPTVTAPAPQVDIPPTRRTLQGNIETLDPQTGRYVPSVSNPAPIPTNSRDIERPTAYNVRGIRFARSAESGDVVRDYNGSRDLVNDAYRGPEAMRAAREISGEKVANATFIDPKYGGGVGYSTFGAADPATMAMGTQSATPAAPVTPAAPAAPAPPSPTTQPAAKPVLANAPAAGRSGSSETAMNFPGSRVPGQGNAPAATGGLPAGAPAPAAAPVAPPPTSAFPSAMRGFEADAISQRQRPPAATGAQGTTGYFDAIRKGNLGAANYHYGEGARKLGSSALSAFHTAVEGTAAEGSSLDRFAASRLPQPQQKPIAPVPPPSPTMAAAPVQSLPRKPANEDDDAGG